MWGLDPTDSYEQPDEYIQEECGLIPYFLYRWDERDAKTQMTERYGFGDRWTDASIDEDGTLNYPGDPPLKPIATTVLREEKVYIYPYGLVSVVSGEGKGQLMRMD